MFHQNKFIFMKKIIAVSLLSLFLCMVSCNKKNNTTTENKPIIIDSIPTFSTTPKDYQINSKTTCYLQIHIDKSYKDSTMISINENGGKITGKIFNRYFGSDIKESDQKGNNIIVANLSGIKVGDTLKVIQTLISNDESSKNQGFYLQKNGYLYPASGTLVNKNGIDMLDKKTIKFELQGYKMIDCKMASKNLK